MAVLSAARTLPRAEHCALYRVSHLALTTSEIVNTISQMRKLKLQRITPNRPAKDGGSSKGVQILALSSNPQCNDASPKH